MELQKSQWIRLLDVFLLGPALIVVGFKMKNLPTWVKLGFIYAGTTTIYYNARNYQINYKLSQEGKIIPLNLTQELEV